MSRKPFLKAIGNIDEQYILEYDDFIHSGKSLQKRRYRRYLATAAAVLLLLITGATTHLIHTLHSGENLDNIHIDSAEYTLSMTPGDANTLEEYSAEHNLTTEKILQDMAVYYQYDASEELYEAAFLFNNSIYIIKYHTQDEEILFELISDILE